MNLTYFDPGMNLYFFKMSSNVGGKEVPLTGVSLPTFNDDSARLSPSSIFFLIFIWLSSGFSSVSSSLSFLTCTSCFCIAAEVLVVTGHGSAAYPFFLKFEMFNGEFRLEILHRSALTKIQTKAFKFDHSRTLVTFNTTHRRLHTDLESKPTNLVFLV